MLALVACCAVITACGSGGAKSASSGPTSPAAVPNGVTLAYAVRPYGERLTQAKVDEAEQIIRRRLAAIGVPGFVETTRGVMRVTVPRTTAENRSTDEAIGGSARLLFYDWEPNVIGPSGKAEPSSGTVTGDATLDGPGAVTAGLTEYQAVRRAAKRPPLLRPNDTTWAAGCTPRQTNGCMFGSWYLLDTASEKILVGPAETQAELCAQLPKGISCADPRLKSVRVNPGTVLMQAHRVENEAGKIINSSPNSYYVLNDNSALTGADLRHPQQGWDEGAGGTGQPDVSFGFTGKGKAIFERITREIAHRGQEAQLPGVTKNEAMQHFAVELDGQLLTVPSVDYTQFPEGIDASTGSQISGGFTVQSARALAAELDAGVLPVSLVLMSHPR